MPEQMQIPPKARLKNSILSGPIPGQSFTTPPKGAPYEKPPQFTTLSDSMNYLMGQLTQPMYLKQMLGLMDGGMPIEAICRSILFIGFTAGKWTPDLAMLMYKPLMLSLLAIAHRAGMHDTPFTMPQSLDQYIKSNAQTNAMVSRAKGSLKMPPKASTESPQPSFNGFMQRAS